MSEQETVTSQQPAVASENIEDTGSEKLVPVSEAIRYRKRAQAAEKQLSELKDSHEKQTEELEQLKQEVEIVKTDSNLQDSSLMPQVSQKTQGVRETRTGGARTVLQTAAKQAAHSGSRADVQEYMRLRRAYV